MDDRRTCPDGWKLARTVEDAMLFLATGDVDACTLDHDMGACPDCVAKKQDIGVGFYSWCPHVLDGTKLVRWMVETGNWPKRKPMVHSANPDGRRRMLDMIDQFYGQPAQGPMF